MPVPGQLVHEDGSDHNHGHGPGFMAGHASLQYGELGVSLAHSDDQLADTYLHELFHLFTYYAQVDVAEADVMRLAPIMLQFLRDNPNVYTFLTGRYTYR